MQAATNDDYQQVRAGFIMQGTSFSRWCADSGVSRAWAIAALSGTHSGPAATALREQILRAASRDTE